MAQCPAPETLGAGHHGRPGDVGGSHMGGVAAGRVRTSSKQMTEMDHLQR